MENEKEVKTLKQSKLTERKGSEKETKLPNFLIAGRNLQKDFGAVFGQQVTSAVDNTGIIQIGCQDEKARNAVYDRFLDVLQRSGNANVLKKYSGDSTNFYIADSSKFLEAISQLKQIGTRRGSTFVRPHNGKHLPRMTPPPPTTPLLGPRATPQDPPSMSLTDNDNNHNPTNTRNKRDAK